MSDSATLTISKGECIRQGDRLPRLEVVPGFDCGTVWDPTAYNNYTLYLFGPLNLSGSVTYDATARALVYNWPAGGTDVAGVYGAIVRATRISDGLQISWPCHGHAEVSVQPLPG